MRSHQSRQTSRLNEPIGVDGLIGYRDAFDGSEDPPKRILKRIIFDNLHVPTLKK